MRDTHEGVKFVLTLGLGLGLGLGCIEYVAQGTDAIKVDVHQGGNSERIARSPEDAAMLVRQSRNGKAEDAPQLLVAGVLVGAGRVVEAVELEAGEERNVVVAKPSRMLQ